MKIGILIVFRNDESKIEVPQFSKLFAETTKLNVCLVNNGSTDNTLKLLKEIQEESSATISIIDVKKNRGHNAAIKAGVRYLKSIEEFSYILCLQKYSTKDFIILEKVFTIVQQEKDIVKSLFTKTKQFIHKNVFSLHGVLEKAS